MSGPARLIFLTAHLSGSGHLIRTLRIAQAARERGHGATVISGGRPLGHLDPGGVEMVQLPPLTVRDLDFATLRDGEGAPASADYLRARQARLVDEIARRRPDVLITELYPFGRRMLRGEFEAAIAAVPGARIVASLRDIPEPKPKRLAETARRLSAGYDLVLVHGDDRVVGLEASWPLPPEAARLIRQTGYLSVPPAPSQPRTDQVLVAVGGGTLGRAALALAVEAACLSPRPWHLLSAGPDAAKTARALEGRHPNLTAEPARPDYPALLARAGASVSLCGYNTATEIAQSDVPALFLPSEEGGEQEQLIRARAFAGAFSIPYLRLEGLTPRALCDGVEAAISAPPRRPAHLGDGAGRAVDTLSALLAETRP